MLSAIVRFAVRFRGVVVALSALLLAYGALRLNGAGLDIFPEFAPKQVIVQTEAPGLSAEQVEILVTQQIEMTLSGLVGLQLIRSESIQGLSIVTVIFDDGSDVYLDRQMVTERLSRLLAGALPDGTGPPVLVPLASSSATVLTLGLTSSSRSLMELRTLADWTLVPRLLAVPGVADVNVFGGDVRQLQVQVQPDKLRRYGLDLETVILAAKQATGVQGAGFVENANQRFTLQVSGQPADPTALAQVVVARENGVNVTLGDVATVAEGAVPPISAAAIKGKTGIVMMVIGQYGANTLTVSRAVEAALADMETLFAKQDIDFHPHLFRPADYIETAIRNLGGHLLAGGLFVVAVLYGFLFNFRTAFISALAIPLSLLAAVIVLLELGINLNIMVLGGLAIALGEVVDDAIIDTENIFRRLRENRRAAATPSAVRPSLPPGEGWGEGEPEPGHGHFPPLTLPQPSLRSPKERGEPVRSTAEVVFSASMEVRGSVVYASFIVALVFAPLLMLTGVAGRLFAPLGFSYILAILMSLGVALTVTPALCYLLLERFETAHGEPPLIRWLQPRYRRLLETVAGRPRAAVTASLAVCGLGLAALPFLGGEFLPQLREGHYIVHTSGLSGTSLEESLRSGGRLVEEFLKIPGVQSASQWAGRAERGADTYGSHYSEYEVRLEPASGEAQQTILDALRATLKRFPGLLFEANTFLTERVDETISGYTAPVVVNVYGSDLDELDAKAQQVADLMRAIPGATDVQLRSPPGTATVDIRLRLDSLASYGLKPAQVLDAVQAAYEGKIVGKRYEGNRIFDVAVILPRDWRQDPDDLEQLPLRSAEGEIVALSQVADIRAGEGRYNVLHRGSRRVQSITGNVAGRDLVSFVTELKSKLLADIAFPADMYPEVTGAAIEQAKARNELILHALLALAGVLILVYIAIGDLRHTLLTLANLPFSLVGGVIAALLTGGIISVGSMVGFVTLFGITVRNAIMLISHYRQLVEAEGKPWNLDTAIQGAQERLPSILMTALVTALAMLPIAVNSDNPGREIMGPMAAIIVGGLFSSTTLNLLLLPAMLLRFGRFDAAKTP
ncbi:efflux RND transporter permease subunit [Methylogaea oryzae]|uniref:Cation efflux system protein n=1 Tax=Methylogaea oryzae TaxID=1295382 RepID=A0A8D4VP62_9GAMM|nr:efflux RND transporter permease subunit [Methylogaea oryzae]BBL70122.1 cation efflux system protein [Methylogaea oryzae]